MEGVSQAIISLTKLLEKVLTHIKIDVNSKIHFIMYLVKPICTVNIIILLYKPHQTYEGLT